MRRRALLASVPGALAGLGGCSFGAPGADETDSVTPAPQPDQSPTDANDSGAETPTDTGDPPRPENPTTVIELATGPRTYALSSPGLHTDDGARIGFWFDRTATDSHPATLRGWLQNGNEFENTFRIDWIPGVGRTYSRQPSGYDHEARLHLAPTENNELAEEVPSLGQTEEGYWRVDDVGPWMPETHRLDPGEWVRLEYALVGEPGQSGRPTGTYKFRGRDETLSVTVWDTRHPGPETESRFAGRSLPSFPGDGSVQWFHEANKTTSAFVRPTAERVQLDAQVGFEMVNNSHERLQCGHWNLYKLVDGEWFHIAPTGHTDDCRILVPGGREQWDLRTFNRQAVDCGTGDCRCDGLTQGYLGGGEYAIVAGYGHPIAESGALVELVGDRAAVTPTDGVSTARDGDTITVTTGRHGDGEHPADATFSLTRTDSASERVIAEQVMASGRFATYEGGLRNALPFLTDGVSRVVVETDERAVDGVLGYDSNSRRFRFRGQAYEVARGRNTG
ncbi:hypothetical protein [Haloarcula argentinensis]|uniref:Uncharacterized protein n=1 Tax=Haloarcula argentinensis TaxID=43776 RepID=A0A830FBY1_HALAR|nr:hypothetical protein [Haloarcula argentinensis]EMA22362.1 hypothetical protein C443_10417 [Haloarcula argentinensis DSM 12282]MDS0252327.1 hypothetical protein [Haloarcula argentinensis]GGM33234.1 hypothetical protein GCM10009006_13410 [Haloarcula argentinensis]